MVGYIVSPSDFTVERFIGRGCYSVVYEVRKTGGPDIGSKYALKRFFLENDSSVKCVLRERQILERLALADFQSPFLPMLCYSIWKNCVSAFVLRKGSGCDLYDLLRHVGCLSETNTRFYIAEIICGLEHLHSMNIVHLDVKPENILFIQMVMFLFLIWIVLMTYHKRLGPRLMTLLEHLCSWLRKLLEVKLLICDQTYGVWVFSQQRWLQALYALKPKILLKNFVGPEWDILYTWIETSFEASSIIFSACLQRQHTQRPYLKGVKELRFLKCVDWCKVESRVLRPPYSTSELRHRITKNNEIPTSSTDINLLSGAFSSIKPVNFISKKSQKPKASDPIVSIDSFHENIPLSLIEAGYTKEKLDSLFTSFVFTHPSLRSCSVNAEITDPLSELSLK
ncbi:unnamed protein product, partial [Heterobilharzia americana]